MQTHAEAALIAGLSFPFPANCRCVAARILVLRRPTIGSLRSSIPHFGGIVMKRLLAPHRCPWGYRGSGTDRHCPGPARRRQSLCRRGIGRSGRCRAQAGARASRRESGRQHPPYFEPRGRQPPPKARRPRSWQATSRRASRPSWASRFPARASIPSPRAPCRAPPHPMPLLRAHGRPPTRSPTPPQPATCRWRRPWPATPAVTPRRRRRLRPRGYPRQPLLERHAVATDRVGRRAIHESAERHC